MASGNYNSANFYNNNFRTDLSPASPAGNLRSTNFRSNNFRVDGITGSYTSFYSPNYSYYNFRTEAAAIAAGDTGSGADALATSATLAITDTVSGSELTPEIDFTVTDAWAGLESEPSIAFIVPDVGSGVDVPSTTATIPISDTGSGAEAFPIGRTGNLTSSNFGTANFRTDLATSSNANLYFPNFSSANFRVEAPATAIWFTPADSWAGAESIPIVSQSLADTGVGLESTPAVAFSVDDLGSGSELIPTVSFTVTDLATGLESIPVVNITFVDVGSGVETTAIAVSFVASDAGAGLEIFSKQFQAFDSGLGGDRFAIRVLRTGRLQYTIRLRVTENVFDPSAFDPYAYE
jgi:hypothetical protein